jgi:hypothetical protein
MMENEVSLHCTQITKVAVFNGIGTSEERRGPLSMLNIGGSDGRASASVSCNIPPPQSVLSENGKNKKLNYPRPLYVYVGKQIIYIYKTNIY